MISHEELAAEMKLREQVSRIVNIVRSRKINKKVDQIIEEQQFREVLQNLILEAAATEPEKDPHPATGINVLEDLLKKVIPILEDDFKVLTTSEEQRNSFRAHIVHAVRNTLAPVRSNDHAGREKEELNEGIREIIIGSLLTLAPALGMANPATSVQASVGAPSAEAGVEKLLPSDVFKEALTGGLKTMDDSKLLNLHVNLQKDMADGNKEGMTEKLKAAIEDFPIQYKQQIVSLQYRPPATSMLDEAVEVEIEDEDEEGKFIDIDGEKAAPEEEPKDPKEEFGLDGEDETGRNAAYNSFKKIENQIVDAYGLLGNDEDQSVFYDYLITNLKLYFDKFETELQTKLGEPSTPEYEKEKEELGAGEDLGGEEEPEEELGL